MQILILNIIIWIWKLTFLFWNLLFNFKKIQKTDIWILNYYFGILNLYFKSKIIDWISRVFSTSAIHNKLIL
jgi:hypothetical protein